MRRYIAELEQAGYVQRIERRAAHGGKQTNIFDLLGLVKRLKELEPEFRSVEDDAKEERNAVSKRGYKHRPMKVPGSNKEGLPLRNAEPRAHT